MTTGFYEPHELGDLPGAWGSHPFVASDFHRWPRAQVAGDEHALLVVASPPSGARFLVGVGLPAQVAPLVTKVPDGGPIVSASLTRGAWERVEPRVRAALALTECDEWDWLWLDEEPAHVPGEDDVIELDLQADREDLIALQSQVLPDTTFTTDREGSRWFGWRDHDRILRAVAGSTGWDHAVHLGSIGTHEAWRGRGLAAAVTAHVTRAGIRATGRVSLGMYADNDPARRLYTRLGFAVGCEVSTRHKARQRD